MKAVKTSLLCGLGAVVVTAILFFLFLGNIFEEGIYVITLFGVIIAEIITTALAYFSTGNPRKVAAAGVSALMVPISLVMAIVYNSNVSDEYGKYIGWYVIFLVIIGVLAAALGRTSDSGAMQSAKNNMLNMRKIVKSIMVLPAAEAYKRDLYEIEEKLHFSNDCVVTAQDERIMNMLLQLQNNIGVAQYDSRPLINEIKIAVDTRNIMANRTV